VEALVLSAAARRDWETAARYARLGRGRLIRLLALVTRAARGETVSAPRLAALWLLAPMRGATLPLGRAATARAARAPAAAADARHVDLLAAAARPGAVGAGDVLAVAEAWRAEIDDAALARLHARALELGVRDGAARAAAVREQVLDELSLLLAHAEGEPP